MGARSPTAVVTGVSRGIGAALYRDLLGRGWRVWGTVRPGEMDKALAALPPTSQSLASVMEMELSDPVQCDRVARRFLEPLDVLVCSAAVFGQRAFTTNDFEIQAMQETFVVNTISPLVLARAFKPRLLQGQKRLQIMMSTGNASLAGNTTGQMLAYRASKSALNQVVRNLAAEWGPEKITTIALNPGWVRTDMGGKDAPLSLPEAASAIAELIQRATPGLNGRFINTDASNLPW